MALKSRSYILDLDHVKLSSGIFFFLSCLIESIFHQLSGSTFIAELQIQILPLIENLEWLYIWGVVVVVCSSDAIVRRSVGRSGDLRIGGSLGILGVR